MLACHLQVNSKLTSMPCALSHKVSFSIVLMGQKKIRADSVRLRITASALHTISVLSTAAMISCLIPQLHLTTGYIYNCVFSVLGDFSLWVLITDCRDVEPALLQTYALYWKFLNLLLTFCNKHCRFQTEVTSVQVFLKVQTGKTDLLLSLTKSC